MSTIVTTAKFASVMFTVDKVKIQLLLNGMMREVNPAVATYT